MYRYQVKQNQNTPNKGNKNKEMNLYLQMIEKRK